MLLKMATLCTTTHGGNMTEVIQRLCIYNIYYMGTEFKGEYLGIDAHDALKRYLGDKYESQHIWYVASRVT